MRYLLYLFYFDAGAHSPGLFHAKAHVLPLIPLTLFLKYVSNFKMVKLRKAE